MSNESLIFTIGAKDTSAQVISKVQKNLKFLEQEYKTASKGSKDFEKTQEGMKAKLDMLNGKYEQTKLKLDAYNKKIDETKTKMTEQAKKIEDVKKSFNMEEAISKSESKMKSYQDKIDKTTASMEKEKAKLESLKSAEGNNADAIAKSENKLKTYQERLDKTVASLDKEKQHLENLKSGHADNTEAVKKAEAQMEKYEQQLTKAQQNIKLTENELKGLTNEIVETNKQVANFKLNQMSESLSKFGEKSKTVGQTVNSFGGELMKLSTPLVTFGAYATKSSMDFEQSMADLQATSGATGESFEALRNKSLELGRDTCKTAGDSAAAMKYLALAGYDNKQILESTEPILKASVAWGADMATSADLATDSMSALGLSTDKLSRYLDVCSQAQRSSNTSATQMMEAYIGCGGTLRTLNVPLEESATVLGRMADQGKKGAEAGNSLNSVLVNLTGGSSTAKGAMDELGVSAWDSNGNFIGLTATLKLLKERLANCTQEQRTNFESAIGGKTQLDTLNMLLNGLGTEYDILSGKINNCSGTTEEMYEIMNNTAKGNIEKLKSKLEGLGIQIGEKIVPHVNNLIDKLGNLIDWFGNLSEGTQELILKTGLVTFATGGFLKVIGSTITNVGNLATTGSKLLKWLTSLNSTTKTAKAAVEGTSDALKIMQGAQAGSALGTATLASKMTLLGPLLGGVAAGVVAVGAALYTAHEYDKLLNGSILDSTDNMTGFQKVLAEMTGIQRYSNAELEDMGLKYKEFSSDIAPETKESMEDIAGKFREVQTEIEAMDFSKAITDDDKNNIISKTDDICKTILSQLDGLQSEMYKKTKDAFMQNDGIIDEEEQKILDKMDTGGNQVKDKVASISNELNNIVSSGQIKTTEGRQSYIDKMKELQDILGEKLLASEKANQQDIEAFESESNTLSLEKASEVLEQKAEIRNKETESIKENYNKQIEAAKEAYELADESDKEYWGSRLNSLEEQKSKELESENSKYDAWLQMINEKYPEVAAQINEYDGQRLSDNDKNCQEILNRLKDTYDGMDSITESGTYTMYDKYNRCWDTITVKTDESTGKIIGIYDNYNGSLGGYTEDICNSMKEQGNQANITAGDVSSSFRIMAGATVNAEGQIVSANGQIIGSLQNVKNNADGTRSGIINLNGTPVRIQTNADGTIRDLNGVINKANAIPKQKTLTITTVFKQIGQVVSGAVDTVKGWLGYAEGTDNATPGIHPVAEEGQELIIDGKKAFLTGNRGTQLYNFKGGETVLTASETRKALSGRNINGGFFNADSMQSQNLINNTTTNTNNTYNNGTNFDYDRLGNVLATSLAKVLSGNSRPTTISLDDIANNTGNNFAMMKRRLRT